ncbi:MAG TPA: glutamine synthetase family protein, partial [Streptosporangiaceae bacterium]|nr:glutamine synthetase family protein [Streptosporangiaceae bacterium]
MNAAPPDHDAPDLDNIAERLRRDKIETVLCAIPDIWGRLVGKRVTTESFLKTALGSEGLHGSLYLFVVDMDMDPRPGYAVSNWDSGFSDFRLVPDVATLRTLPWLPATAIVICDAFHEDADGLVEVAPRTILRRQIEAGRAAGVTFKFASELEFYLFRNAPAEAWQRQYQGLEPLSYYRSDYHILQSSKDDWIISKIRNGMNAAGIEVEFSKSEWGLGQQEVNLRYTHVLEMADRHLLYKNGVKEIAALNGLTATFMAKPSMDDIGSSFHAHVSLWDETADRSLMHDAQSPGRMSEVFRTFLGGLLENSRQLAWMSAPNVNSYKRFQSSSFAPTAIAWGEDNRTCGFRVVGEHDSLRVENRIPGADANPYLMIAAMLAGGLHGIETAAEPPEPSRGNAAEDLRSPALPGSLPDAIAALRGSDLARELLGSEFVDHFALSRQVEWDLWAQWSSAQV